jgi:hypothetical protein
MADNQIISVNVTEEEPDDVDHILAVLGHLVNRITNPVVRVCLADAYEEIAHLTGRDSRRHEDQAGRAAA